MKSILIFNNSFAAGAYGIGSFVKLLKNIFTTKDYEICEIEIYSEEKELTIIYEDNYTAFRIPTTEDVKVTCIVDLLLLHLGRIVDNSIAFFNYSSQFEIAKAFAQRGLRIHTVGVVHSFAWMWSVRGNERVMCEFIKEGCYGLHRHVFDNFIEEQEGFNCIDKVVSLSTDSSQTLEVVYGVDKSKIVITPNGIIDEYVSRSICLVNKVKKELTINKKEKILLYVGRLDVMKGIDILVSVFNKMVLENRNYRLVIIGDGEFRFLPGLIGKTALKITFTGRISQKEVRKWYSIADIGILPSLSEECSFVGIEMMMHGLPIIATNARGVRNMFHHMQNCLSVNCKKGKKVFERELYKAIIKILNYEELSNDLRQKSRQWYLDNYQFKFMKQNYLSLIEEITREDKL